MGLSLCATTNQEHGSAERRQQRLYSQSSGNTKVECSFNFCRDKMDTDSNMIEPTDFDSKSFLEVIEELKTTLEPAVSCSDDLKLQEVIDAVTVGNRELTNFKLFSLYTQILIENVRESVDAAIQCIDKMLGGSFKPGNQLGKYHEGETSG